jgi:hypothetical protein
MDQNTRNTLRNVVTQCRRLLEESVAQVLQGQFGIYAAGKKDEVQIEPEARMSHLSEEDRAYRQDLLDHYEHIKALGYKAKDALAQLIREVAFTHLNRFSAYRMMESRNLIRESVSKGLKSQGFLFYLADHEEDERRFNTGQQDVAYRHFLNWLGGTLSEEIGVLFAPTDPANRLYPPQRVIDQVLGLLNDPELAGIWSEDEAIGWVYQYFTPKELRDQARKESQAPRNSYELAFRNQFFTPRYVVEFLTDNTLGRIWYEMRQGNTRLKDQCRYMVRRPTEVFLKDGEAEPKDAVTATDDLSQEELLKLPVYMPFRVKKDPRELKILDPACGSGHFLLYCFDLLLTIYEEAYADPDLGPALKKDYPTLDALKRDVPRLILAHNLHGIDIDLRASQIAALALWLRCQRAYREMELKKDRPKITRSNFVCAEPMPGEGQMLKEFVGQLEPKVLGQVVEVVFDKMKLAGEAGSLLKIEEGIRDAVAAAKKQYVRQTTQATDRRGQPLLFTQAAMDRLDGKPNQPSLFDLSDITDNQFFEQAEARVIEALRSYAEKAQNGQRLQRRLFSEDAVRGFAFVDLCQKQYDVCLTNPPFGLPSLGMQTIGTSRFDIAISKNLAWAMMERCASLTTDNGYTAAIVDRTIFQKSSYEPFRTGTLKEGALTAYVDLGIGVLDDADVMTCCYAFSKQQIALPTVFFDERQCQIISKAAELTSAISMCEEGLKNSGVVVRYTSDFDDVPFSSMSYWVPRIAIQTLFNGPTIKDSGFHIAGGLQCNDVFRFIRIYPENLAKDISNKRWVPFYNGGPYSLYWIQTPQYVLWAENGADIKDKIINELGDSPSRFVKSEGMYLSPGVAGGKRGEYFDVHIFPEGAIFSNEGRLFQVASRDAELSLLAYLNSHLSQNLVNVFCGQHKGSEYLRRVPLPTGWIESALGVGEVLSAINEKRKWSSLDECGQEFISPWAPIPSMTHVPLSLLDISVELKKALDESNSIVRQAEHSIKSAIATLISEELVEEVEASGWTEMPRPDDKIENISDAIATGTTPIGLAQNVLQYCVGIDFGRWDVRQRCLQPQPVDGITLFHPIPVCTLGMLRDQNDLPLNETPNGYPVRVSWDGLLVDDPDSQDDIVLRVRDVLEVIWQDRAEAIEKEACDILGVKELRDYFRKPGKGGFWDDHISRYSKSRRKAPIYWLLQSSKKNYAIWLYYHRLDKDILFKALVNYVEPKIRLEDDRLQSLRAQKGEGGTGKASKKLDKEIEKQEEFLSELRDFEEKLRRAAELHLVPDLNDGVVLNIAPLHELVPWKEAEKYWEELLEGKYEWSSIGKQLREKGLVK